MSKGGCCSFHYCGWREELNEGIDKRLKKKKRKEERDRFWKNERKKGSIFKKMIEEAAVWDDG